MTFKLGNPGCECCTPPEPPPCGCQTGLSCLPEGQTKHQGFTLVISNVPDEMIWETWRTKVQCPESSGGCNKYATLNEYGYAKFAGLAQVNGSYPISRLYYDNGWIPEEEYEGPNTCGWWAYPVIDFDFRYETYDFRYPEGINLTNPSSYYCLPNITANTLYFKGRFRTRTATFDRLSVSNPNLTTLEKYYLESPWQLPWPAWPNANMEIPDFKRGREYHSHECAIVEGSTLEGTKYPINTRTANPFYWPATVNQSVGMLMHIYAYDWYSGAGNPGRVGPGVYVDGRNFPNSPPTIPGYEIAYEIGCELGMKSSNLWMDEWERRVVSAAYPLANVPLSHPCNRYSEIRFSPFQITREFIVHEPEV